MFDENRLDIHFGKPGDEIIDLMMYNGYDDDEALWKAATLETLMLNKQLADIPGLCRMGFVQNVRLTCIPEIRRLEARTSFDRTRVEESTRYTVSADFILY